MNFKKEFELKTSKDLYILETTNDFIITNDEYSGITILDKNLNIIKNVTLFKGVTIYSIYKHFSKDEILLYCCDNGCMIWMNLLDFSYKIIPLGAINSQIAFSPVYFWKDDIIILTTYSNQFYIINSDKIIIKNISTDMIRQNYEELYNFLNKVIENLPCYPAYNSKFNSYIINYDSTNNSILLIDDIQTMKMSLYDNFDYHDFIYSDYIVACISESLIQIINLKNIKELSKLAPETNYQFLKARFYNNNNKINLIILSGGIQKIRNSLITTYQINQE
jgi:hypothetical protein